MIKVIPMPDEPVVAHEARRRRVVGARDQQEHFAWMRQDVKALDGAAVDVTQLDLLATASGLQPERYAVEHSFLANFVVAAPRHECHCFGSRAMSSRAEQFGLRLSRKLALVCHACIDEDMANERFSWFRRQHHIVGVDSCRKHRMGLHRVNAQSPFEHPPHQQSTEVNQAHPL